MHFIWLLTMAGSRDARKLNRTVVLCDLKALKFRLEHGLT